MTPQVSDIADGIIPEKRPEHISPPRAIFKPWHKVRKQYIRKCQWNELAKRNVNGSWRTELQRPSVVNIESPSSMHILRPLRCLVIPGDDLLDVRSLWNEINPLDCFIHYLGFNEGHGSCEADTDVHVANHAVTSLPGVLPNSQVLRDRFEAISAPGSLAFKYLREYGPYHIVNLDLCGSMFPNSVKDVEPYYTAVNRLLEYQFANQNTNWLLFITTMVEPGVVDREHMQRLCMPTRMNCDSHPQFAEKMEELMLLPSLQDKGAVVNLSGISDDRMVSLFGVALGKWLLHLGQSPSPKWTVGMRRSFQYTINEEKGAIMLSLAFEMTPNISPPVDATGMSALPVTPRLFLSEAECAVKLAESVSMIFDVDEKLASEAELRAMLFDESADLLASAGYDRDKYVQWVKAGETASR